MISFCAHTRLTLAISSSVTGLSKFLNPAKVKLSINPGAVHAGGLITTKNEADFDKITPALLSEMYSQLFLSDDLFADVCRLIQHLSSK